MNSIKWSDRIGIWEGLEDFRKIILELFSLNISKINQKTLDHYFRDYNLILQPSRKSELTKTIKEQQDQLDPKSSLFDELEEQLKSLDNFEEEFIIQRQSKYFTYDYIFRDPGFKAKNLLGFVKITNKLKPSHKGLLSWQHGSRDPILFLVELMGGALFFHINLGDGDGLAIIEETSKGYRWTHCLESEYSQMINAESGAIFMDKTNKRITLEDSNIAAAAALSKAQTRNDQGITVLENNIKLMNLYKEDLAKIDFFF